MNILLRKVGKNMKTFIFIHKFYILAIAILLLIVGSITYNYYHNRYLWNKATFEDSTSEKNYQDCINNTSDYTKENCDSIIIQHDKKEGILYHYLTILREITMYFPYTWCMFIMLPAILPFAIKTKKGKIKNILTRKKYKSFFRQEYLKSLTTIFIVPIVFLLLFLFICIKENWYFNFYNSFEYTKSVLFYGLKDHFIIAFITYLILILLQGVTYVNIAYIINHKCKHIIMLVVGCWLAYFGAELLTEITYGIIYRITHNSPLASSIPLNIIWSIDSYKLLIYTVVTNIIYVITTTFIVFKMYKDKETEVILSEQYS